MSPLSMSHLCILPIALAISVLWDLVEKKANVSTLQGETPQRSCPNKYRKTHSKIPVMTVFLEL